MMTAVERSAARARFARLLASPAIQKSLDFRQKYPNNPRLEETSVGRMASPERVDAIIKIFRFHYSK